MSLGAWIMLAFGCAVLYGGLFICIRIAINKELSGVHPDSEVPHESDNGVNV